MSIYPAKNCKWPSLGIFLRNFIKLIIIFFLGWFIHFQNSRALPYARISYWVLSRIKHEPMLLYLLNFFFFFKNKSLVLRLIDLYLALGLRACEVSDPNKLGNETLTTQWNRFGSSFLPYFYLEKYYAHNILKTNHRWQVVSCCYGWAKK